MKCKAKRAREIGKNKNKTAELLTVGETRGYSLTYVHLTDPVRAVDCQQ